MIIPLSINYYNDSLTIYRNGNSEIVDLPFKPFILIEDKFESISGIKEKWIKVPENEERNYIRYSFNSSNDLFEFKKKNNDKAKSIFSNNYIEQLFISNENFLLQYPNTSDIKVLYWDIEVASKGDGLFPRALTCPIVCIGWSTWIYKVDGSKRKINQKILKSFNIEKEDDSVLLKEFINDVHSEDPDIIAGYNIDEFDGPYLIERCQLNKISMVKLGRSNKEPYIKDEELHIPGRIKFDIYKSNAGVIKDQTLFGIKSRTLKELARWYKIKRTTLTNSLWHESEMDDIEVKNHIENILGLVKTNPNLLYAYQEDDVYRTEGVGNVYLRNCITLAEMLKVPLNNIINMYSSFIPKLFVARNMEKLKLINTESNFSKYNLQNGSISKLGTKYQGALVGLYKDGFFESTYKVDFSSMYPSAAQTFNLGPDTTSLVSVESYTGQYKCIIDNKYNWYRIPTEFEEGKFKYDLIVKVRNDKEGFLKKEITELRKERVKIRKEMKTCKPEDKDILNSQQNAIKVILNSIYGILGLKSSLYGEMISAAAITGMCRWTTTQLINKFKDTLIELDTDGLILKDKVDPKEINSWLDKLIKDNFNITDNYMQVEMDEFGRSFFYAMKNYIVQHNEDYVVHGSSLKSSKFAPIIDRATKLAIENIFNSKPVEEVIMEAYNFSGLTVDAFTERVNLSKEKREYDDQYDYRLFLAKQVEKKTGQILTKGAQISFVVTKKPLNDSEFKDYIKSGWNYTFVSYVNDIKDLNLNYYEELITKHLEKFGIRKIEQTELDLFGLNYSGEVRKIPRKKKLNVVK